MAELGITPKTLGEIRTTVRGVQMRTDDIISVYIAMQNEDSMRHLVDGNNIDHELAGKLVGLLSENEKAWGDWMIESFGQENFNRILEVMIADQNKVAPKVQRYFPILSEGGRYDYISQEAASDMLSRTPYSRTYASKKFTISRNRGARNPMRLGATAIWTRQVAMQEKYINQGMHIKKLQRIVNHPDVKKAMYQKYGKPMHDWLQKYVNDYANPDIYRMHDDLSKVSRIIRSHAAMSYLGLNLVTMVKQLPSVAFYLPHAGAAHMIRAAGQFATNPKEVIEFVRSRDPQAADRALDRFEQELREISQEGYEGFVRRLGTFTMQGIRLMDTVAVTIGWKSVYDRSIAEGLSPAEASRRAQQVTLDTQPSARAKDLAEIYRSNEGFNWFLMFSNQLNQIWNMMFADIPQALRQKQIGRALATATSIAISGAVIGWVSHKDWPDEEEGAGKILGRYMAEQFVSAVPVVGGNIKSGMSGWFGTGVDPVPVASQLGRTARIMADADKDGGAKFGAMMDLLVEGMVTAGLPTVQTKRIHDTLFAEEWFEDPQFDPWELIGGLE